jgi:hypothetical protein
MKTNKRSHLLRHYVIIYYSYKYRKYFFFGKVHINQLRKKEYYYIKKAPVTLYCETTASVVYRSERREIANKSHNVCEKCDAMQWDAQMSLQTFMCTTFLPITERNKLSLQGKLTAPIVCNALPRNFC